MPLIKPGEGIRLVPKGDPDEIVINVVVERRSWLGELLDATLPWFSVGLGIAAGLAFAHWYGLITISM
jgi:hypothetical protein